MASIQQAAHWIMGGRDVSRRGGKFWLTPMYPGKFCYVIVCEDGGEHVLDCFDLLADDWELHYVE